MSDNIENGVKGGVHSLDTLSSTEPVDVRATPQMKFKADMLVTQSGTAHTKPRYKV